MSNRVPREKADLARHLEEQLGFLEVSGSAYDAGYDSEAKRLAVTLRVLLHDTEQSRSLLGQLGLKARLFLDTTIPRDPNSLTGYLGLAAVEIKPRAGRHVPFLDRVFSDPKWIPFDDWWAAPIIARRGGASLSRKLLVLTMANQDGGAHVDPSLDEFYARISRQNELGWVHHTRTSQTPIQGKEKASVRQIAHEVLKTMVPGYSKVLPDSPNAVIVAGVELVAQPPDKTADSQP